MKTINGAVDRLLAKLLRSDAAGACVPDHGDLCAPDKYVCHLGRLHRTYYGRVQCNGSCPNPVTTNAGTC